MKRNKNKAMDENVDNIKIDHLFSITSIVPKDYEFSSYGESYIHGIEDFATKFCESTQVDELTPFYLDGYIDALIAIENSYSKIQELQHKQICNQIAVKAKQDSLVCDSIIDFCKTIGGVFNEKEK